MLVNAERIVLFLLYSSTCLAGWRAVIELAAIRQCHLFEKATRLPGAQRRDDGRDLVADLDHIPLPAGPIEDAGVGAFDRVALR